MDEYKARVKLTCLEMTLLLVFYIAGAAASGQTHIIKSLLLGGFASYIYFFLLAYRVYKAADMHPLVGMRYMHAGWGLRLAFICAVVVIGLKLPDIKFLPLFLGLYTYQVAVHIDSIITILREYLRK